MTEMQPGRWWRVIAPDGSLWCETSDEDEARTNTRPGDTLQRLWTHTENEWRTVAPMADDETISRLLLVGSTGSLKSLAASLFGGLPIDHWAMAPVDPPPVIFTETDVRFFEAMQALDTTPLIDYDEDMISTTTDRNGNYLANDGCDICACGCKYWENDRCIDCGQDVLPDPLAQAISDDSPDWPDRDGPSVCQWLVHDTNEDGPCARPCGQPVEDDERGVCPIHAYALSIPDTEFERRVEAGETWS